MHITQSHQSTNGCCNLKSISTFVVRQNAVGVLVFAPNIKVLVLLRMCTIHLLMKRNDGTMTFEQFASIHQHLLQSPFQVLRVNGHCVHT
jgi:hypothetical protein